MVISSKDIVKRRFETPDEHRSFPRGGADIVTIAGVTLGLSRFEPGWKWSEHVKPIVGTESHEAEHLGYLLSGRLHTKMDDGSEAELVAGDLAYIPAGHDGWTVGDEPVVFLEILGTAQ